MRCCECWHFPNALLNVDTFQWSVRMYVDTVSKAPSFCAMTRVAFFQSSDEAHEAHIILL